MKRAHTGAPQEEAGKSDEHAKAKAMGPGCTLHSLRTRKTAGFKNEEENNNMPKNVKKIE